MSDNGADDSFSGREHSSVTEQGPDVGRSVVVESGGPSPVNSLLLDQESNQPGLTAEWDTYVDRQIECGWDDLPYDEQSFCNEFLDNGYKHIEAAVSIGRARSAGIRLLNKPLCREFIHYHEQARRNRRIVHERFFDAQLQDLYDQAIGEVEIPIVTGSGMELKAKKHNGPLALAIIQERSKMSGVAKPEIADAASGVNVIIDVRSLLGKSEIKEVN